MKTYRGGKKKRLCYETKIGTGINGYKLTMNVFILEAMQCLSEWGARTVEHKKNQTIWPGDYAMPSCHRWKLEMVLYTQTKIIQAYMCVLFSFCLFKLKLALE